MRCVVEFFGLPREITDLQKVEVGLKSEANLKDVIAVLRHEIPGLEGTVIDFGENQLMKYYAFNINGRFYLNDSDIKVKDSDRIVLLALAIGG